MDPEVSIIIVNYNTFELTRSCIRSVVKFSSGFSYEIILVDNHSTDCDPAALAEEFPQLKLVRNETNEGFARANNAGIALARGNYILLLNSDTELTENSIAVCLEKLKAEKNTGVITCNLVYPDGRKQAQCQRFPSFWPEFLEATRLFKLMPQRTRENVLQGVYFTYDRPIHPDWVWGTFFFFKKEILDSLPGKKLGERFFMYCEDLEWCYCIRRAGWNILFEPSTKVVHHVGGSGSGNRELKLRKIVAHEKIFVQTYFGSMRWFWIRFFRLMNYSFTKKKNPVHQMMYAIYRET